MQNVRCGFCGYETAGPYCLRCKARVTQAATRYEARGSSQRGGGSGGRALRRLVVLALLAAAGLAVYSYRYRIWYGPGAEYALAIGEAEQFNRPLSVSAKRSITRARDVLGVPTDATDGSDPVHVLKARGYVEFGSSRTEERVVGTRKPLRPLGLFGNTPAPEPVQIKQTYTTSLAALTPSGEQVADGWEDSGDTWRVPIGSRELYRVDSFGEVESAAGVEACAVEFSWRWRPNTVGEAFDTDGKVYASLPEGARAAVLKFNWGSAKVYRAVARLERRPGGPWRVVSIKRSEDVDEDNELSAF